MKYLAVALSFSVCSGAAVSGPRMFAKGYVRKHRRGLLGVEHVSQTQKDSAPDALDWVAKGATTAVKDQGSCGDCWAFATAEGIESAVYMADGKLVGLSEQQLTACVTECSGCGGGDPTPALNYVKTNGIDSQADYSDSSPESGKTGKCSWDSKVVARVTGYRYAIPSCTSGPCNKQDENALAAAVAQYGPLTICINAGPWNNTEGWTTDKVVDFGGACPSDGDKLDHCVQLVGYDKSSSPPYWKIRNSWTANWGEKGFIRLPFGKNACGLANEVFIIEANSSVAADAQRIVV